MKSLIFGICFVSCLFYYPTTLYAYQPPIDAREGIPYKYTPEEGSVEELYKDIISTQLLQCIDSEIKKNYGQLLQYDLFDIEFLSIVRNNYRSFSFLIKLKVQPFVGAHNTIGIDEITVSLSPYETKVVKFEHIKSFPVPPWLEES